MDEAEVWVKRAVNPMKSGKYSRSTKRRHTIIVQFVMHLNKMRKQLQPFATINFIEHAFKHGQQQTKHAQCAELFLNIDFFDIVWSETLQIKIKCDENHFFVNLPLVSLVFSSFRIGFGIPIFVCIFLECSEIPKSL